MEQILTKYPFSGFLETRIGGRPENQDSFGYVETPDGLLVIVCDGMGGGPGGKIASSIAVEVIKQSVLESSHHFQSREEALKTAVDRAHDALLRKMQEVPALRGMGTTIAALYINYESAVVLHIGDSRIYKLRDGSKMYRTQDHSMVGDMVRSGTLTEEQARLSAQANIITRAIGIEGKCIPVFDEIPFEKGDRFVLCSDGIWGAMPESQLIKNLSERRSLANIVESLSNKVDSLGHDKGNHHDNLTLVMVDTKIDSKLKEKMNRKAKMIIAAISLLLIISVIFNMVQSCSKSKSLSRESEIENLEKIKQDQNDTIKELRKQIDILNKKGKKTNNEKIPSSNDKGQLPDESNQRVKDSQKSEDNTEDPAASTESSTADFNKEIEAVIASMRDLLNIHKPTQNACTQGVEKLIDNINKKINGLVNKYTEKKDVLNELLITDKIYVEEDKGVSRYILTKPCQKIVNNKIQRAKELLN